MPATPLVTGMLVQTTLVGEQSGQRVLNGFTYVAEKLTGAPTVDDLYEFIRDQVWGTGAASWQDTFLSCCPSDYELEFTDVQVFHPDRLVKARYNVALPGNGEDPAKLSCISPVYLRRGDLGTRRDISTLHMPAIENEFFANGLLTAPMVALLEDFLPFLTMAHTSASGEIRIRPCIYHRDYQFAYSLITQAHVQPQVRTMRRRVVGRGE